ncbi:MAG: DegV family protein [Chloroflexota bacterium]|nr:DegV family protein [Chloroflexota bacterium]
MATKPIIVTDSTSDLTPEEIERYGIRVVPLNVHFGSKVYQDTPASRTEFFDMLADSPVRPSTSAPSLASFQEIYRDACPEAGADIISIHISGKLSETVRRARQAAERMLGRCHVHVVDSEVTSVGLGILAKHAAQMSQEGASAEEIIRTLRGMIDHIYVVFFVESLDFLEQGGRIGKAQALLGTMLNIKPMLILEEGEIEPLEKVRTRARALDKLAEFVSEFGYIESLTIMHHQASPEEIQGMIERIENVRGPDIPIYVAQYGPVLAAHIGPDALGLVVYEGLRDDPWEW